MVHPDFKSLRAVCTLVGSIVGAGVLGLPYVFAKSSPAVGMAWLLGLGAVMLALYLMYAEVVVQTPGTHRLGGYAERYLSPRWAALANVALGLSLLGAMSAHVIIGSQFLYNLFSPLIGGTEVMYAIGMTVAAAGVTWRGTKFTSRAEGIIISVVLFLFVFAILASLPHLSLANFTLDATESVFLPYGVILFSLSGLGAVPEMKDVLGARKHQLPHVVTAGLLLVVALYLVFSLAVVGVTGAATTPSALIGLSAALGGTFAVASSFLGVLMIFSIFSMCSLQLQNSLRYDVRVPRATAWAIASIIPLCLYFLGVRSFIGLVGFVGSALSGLVGVIAVMIYERMRRSPVCVQHRCLNVPSLISFGVILLFVAGMVTEFASFAR